MKNLETTYLICIFILIAGLAYTAIKRDYYISRVKELETENEMLREKIKEIKFPKPTLRMYNQKCDCSCG